MSTKITADMLQRNNRADTPSPLQGFDDEMFGISKSVEIIKDGDKRDIEVDKLVEYENQPFKMYNDDKLNTLAENIKENGILSPVLVRPIDGEDKYQILAGHNRTAAARLIGLEKVPCIIRYADDVQAVKILVDTNLNQREEILPSEKAYAYKMRLDSLKSASLSDFSSASQIETRQRSDEALASEVGESRAQVQRIIRLTYLDKALLDMVDGKSIPVAAGVELSYLTDSEQFAVLRTLQSKNTDKMTIDQAKLIRRLARDGGIDYSRLSEIIDGEYRPPQPPPAPRRKTQPSERVIKQLERAQKICENCTALEMFTLEEKEMLSQMQKQFEALLKNVNERID